MITPIHLALADDHLLVRKGLCMLIEEFENMQILTDASNGRELLCTLPQLELLPDICILDVRMPELNGFETLLEVKRRWPEIKVLMLSMYSNELNIVKLLRSGADGYIVKDCKPEELHSAIVHIHNGGIYYPNELLLQMQKLTPANIKDVFPDLTTKEYLFLAYCSTELTYKEIANRMNQSIKTIEGYRDSLFKKLNLKTRLALAVYSIESGIAAVYPVH